MSSSNRNSATSSFFPNFLLPSIPFRRRARQDSSDSTASTGSTASASSPTEPDAAPPSTYLAGHASSLRCARCSTDLCLTSQIVSKGFTGRHGRAYLVSPSLSAAPPPALLSLPNTHTHSPVPRQLVTGAHTVCDISCLFCGTVLGWKYVAAEDEGQRYKVGKFILEAKRVRTAQFWEDDGDDATTSTRYLMPPVDMETVTKPSGKALGDQEIEFDSQDEDECEDLFMGVWSPALAMKRRKARKFTRAGTDGFD
ncbi:MAG: hypothetical protein M4579_000328 [Chaenotheca gracillima]|nr:MAG: hypothetical protein M4579_000328 [Chaenotheca gracillima]